MEPTTTQSFPSPSDGLAITYRTWEPAEPRAIVQIAHGVAEHGRRYARLAHALVSAGYLVAAVDHRGHGDSVSGQVPLGSFGDAGWAALTGDITALTRRLQAEHPGVPIVLLGHSMGSFASQEVLLDHSADYAAAVLSGSSALDVLLAGLAAAGVDGAGDLTAFNAAFEFRTGFEWLSRDEAEVDLYVADPLCGFETDETVIPQMFGGATRCADADALSRLRPDLPILLISGDADPLAGGGQLIMALAARYQEAGVRDVTVSLYPEARHETFNETNREEVTADLIAWLAEQL